MRDAVDALGVQREPVQHRRRRACLTCDVEVLGVGRENLVRAGEQRVGGRMQGTVLRLGAQCGQRAGRATGPAGGVVDLLAQVGNRRCLQTHQPSVSNMSGAFDTCQVAGLVYF